MRSMSYTTPAIGQALADLTRENAHHCFSF